MAYVYSTSEPLRRRLVPHDVWNRICLWATRPWAPQVDNHSDSEHAELTPRDASSLQVAKSLRLVSRDFFNIAEKFLYEYIHVNDEKLVFTLGMFLFNAPILKRGRWVNFITFDIPLPRARGAIVDRTLMVAVTSIIERCPNLKGFSMNLRCSGWPMERTRNLNLWGDQLDGVFGAFPDSLESLCWKTHIGEPINNLSFIKSIMEIKSLRYLHINTHNSVDAKGLEDCANPSPLHITHLTISPSSRTRVDHDYLSSWCAVAGTSLIHLAIGCEMDNSDPFWKIEHLGLESVTLFAWGVLRGNLAASILQSAPNLRQLHYCQGDLDFRGEWINLWRDVKIHPHTHLKHVSFQIRFVLRNVFLAHSRRAGLEVNVGACDPTDNAGGWNDLRAHLEPLCNRIRYPALQSFTIRGLEKWSAISALDLHPNLDDLDRDVQLCGRVEVIVSRMKEAGIDTAVAMYH